ncbi:50S ribosomal protein L11 methyltransferase [Halobacteriovorax sp. GFR7]|uniref:50S ribosomal protein L11 methyltransferase n=1 Tax=unclassified Halobacteriovorax TaxID=2639665 RepID=UPI003D9924B1
MSVKTEIFKIVTIEFQSSSQCEEVNKIALNEFEVDGIEEFSMEEDRVDEILGERAYSGGDVPESVIDEVVDISDDQDIKKFNYFFFQGDINRAHEFAKAIEEMDLSIEVKDEEYSDWNEVWKKHYAPIEVTPELSVIPEWFKEEDYKENNNNIYIIPGMGFGTGEHETTYLCLKHFMAVKDSFKEKDLCLDFGCGSGILGIGAIKKSDMLVDFVDIDPAALDNCHENLKLNLNEDRLNGHRLIARKRFNLDDKYKLVFANILMHVLVSEKEVLLDSLADDGYIILSGILNEQVDAVIEEYKSLKKIDVLSKGDWSAILLKKE